MSNKTLDLEQILKTVKARFLEIRTTPIRYSIYWLKLFSTGEVCIGACMDAQGYLDSSRPDCSRHVTLYQTVDFNRITTKEALIEWNEIQKPISASIRKWIATKDLLGLF